MPEFENFPTREELEAKHESKKMPGSHDISMSTVVKGIDLQVKRPGDDEMYGVFLNGEEVMMIGGSTAYAEKIFDGTAEILRSGVNIEEAKRKIGELVTKVIGGRQESK
jgi:hypothetical protein